MVEQLIITPTPKAKNGAIKIFNSQITRKILPSEFLEGLISKISQGNKEQLPENLPKPPVDIVKLIDNEKDYNKHKEIHM